MLRTTSPLQAFYERFIDRLRGRSPRRLRQPGGPIRTVNVDLVGDDSPSGFDAATGIGTATGFAKDSRHDTAAVFGTAQTDDPASMLTFTRDLIALRRASMALRRGPYATHAASDDTIWVWERGPDVLVALNFGAAPRSIAAVNGTIAICTDRRRDGESIADTLHLGAFEGVVVERR